MPAFMLMRSRRHDNACGLSGRAAIFALALVLVACDQAPMEPDATPPAPTPPVAQHTPPPDYPPDLACKRIGGQAVLDVSLAANGVPVTVKVFRSSGAKALDDSAVAAVREWTFKPATVRGKPATSKLQVPVTFTPPDPPPDECNRYL